MANIYGVKFDKVNDYFDLQDDAAWNIVRSNGSQFYAFWLSQDANTGADSQYWFSNNGFNVANSVQCYVDEVADDFHFNPANPVQSVATGAKTFPTGRVLVVCQYNHSTLKLEMTCCPEGGVATRTLATVNLSSDITSSNWNLGRRQDGNAGRYYEGTIYNVAKATGYLSDGQIENLASNFLNYEPTDEFTPEIYFPMNEGQDTTITDSVLGLIGTGIGFPGDDSQWTFVGTSGGQTISPPTIPSTAVVHTPTVLKSTTITPGPITSTAVVYTPTITRDKVITPGHIYSQTIVHRPTLSGDAVVIPESLSVRVQIQWESFPRL